MKAMLVSILLIFLPVASPAQEELQITWTGEGSATTREISYEHLPGNQLRVTVLDNGSPVGGLQAEDFKIRSRLSEYKVVKVEPLLNTESAKVTLILCIDNSNSMHRHTNLLLKTLDQLLQHLGPSTKIGTVFFREGYRGNKDLPFEGLSNIKVYPPTRDKEAVRDRLSTHLLGEGLSARTYLYDELYSGVKLLQTSAGDDADAAKFVIVLSDGLDNASVNASDEISALINETPDVVFYTIDYLQNINPFLVDVANNSNGRHFQAKRAEELAPIFEDITGDLVVLSGYRITYRIPQAFVGGCVVSRVSCTPLTDVEITASPSNDTSYTQSLGVEEDGHFRGRLAFPHTWNLRAEARGYLPETRTVVASEEALYLASFRLRPAYVSYRGYVLDAGTDTLTGATVVVTDLTSGDILFEGENDSLGSYGFKSRVDHDILVTATKTGYTFGSVELRDLTHATPVPDITLGLTAEGFVSEFRFLFEFDSDELDLEDRSTVTQLEGCVNFVERELSKSPTRMVRLVGWTDSVGDPDYNLNLSQRRAAYVGNYLIEQGIDAEAMATEGNGVSDKYDNATDEGRALNRRTDVIFFDSQPVAEKGTSETQ